MDTRERAEKRQELVASGYAWDMIDNWQAKTDLYWHIDKKNATGGIGFKKGTVIKNVPGTPDYLLKMARNGAYSYPPTTDCECNHCSYERKKEEAEDVTIDRVPASSSNKQTSVDDGVYNKPEEKQEAI
mgnify:FL=1|tara:strand:- start:437 stop:823 length:387 start_codon:yes stop_codon:yes gene_type:complete